MAVVVTLPDGTQKSFPGPVTALQVAESIGSRLAQATLAAKVDGKVVDATTLLSSNCALELITESSREALEIIRHSTAHLLAMAVQSLYPKVQVTIGPVVDTGFYYDFFSDKHTFTPEDLEKIEKKMKEIADKKLPVKREEVSRDEAVKRFEKIGEVFKVQIVQELPAGEAISIYHQGDWFDLCRGPHVPDTGRLKAFKLTHLSGAYWKGDEKNPRLQRIYGTAFPTKKELEEHLIRLEEAKKRDHRKLGRELKLFTFRDEAPAMAFFYPNGQTVYNQLVDYIRNQNTKRGYREVQTPLIMDETLWHRSGHWDNYKENMYFTEVDERINAVKPMNCPGHVLIYETERHSYRELPLRLCEFGRVHRYERSGVTHGLFRVRSFVQDDAHIFCTPEQIEQEVIGIINYVQEVYRDFQFQSIRVGLSTRPAKSIGTEEIWQTAEKALHSALKTSALKYELYPGDGAFYGPKIDFHVEDSLGRLWQCGTIQLDFSMPARFGISYIGEDNTAHTPVMIHRAVLGSVERFMGILVEHFSGAFPFWLAPVQFRLLNITDGQAAYLLDLKRFLEERGYRIEVDLSNEKLGAKIREAQMSKAPVTIVIGDKEQQTKTVSLRPRQGDQVQGLTWDQLCEYAQALKSNEQSR